MIERITFIGLGTMGYPMAGHLVRQGYQVTGYNRTGATAQRWAEEYQAAWNPELPAAVDGAQLVITCVGNDRDLEEVLLDRGVMDRLAPGSLIVDHSTTSADIARRMAAEARSRGLAFIDAPVSGGQQGAQKGQLTIMCGGDQDAFDRVKPVLSHYARAISRMGDSGAGQLTKMVNQIALTGILQSLSEALNFAELAGLDGHQVVQVISKGAAQSWQMDNRADTMLKGEFDFGFAVDLMRKDLGLVLSEARRINAALPVASLVDQFYAEVQNIGGGRWDTSSLIQRLRQLNKR